jgi:hypothetical protein
MRCWWPPSCVVRCPALTKMWFGTTHPTRAAPWPQRCLECAYYETCSVSHLGTVSIRGFPPANLIVASAFSTRAWGAFLLFGTVTVVVSLAIYRRKWSLATSFALSGSTSGRFRHHLQWRARHSSASSSTPPLCSSLLNPFPGRHHLGHLQSAHLHGVTLQ